MMRNLVAVIQAIREDFGLRWQSAAATPLFNYRQNFHSGVALRFPPQSKKIGLRLKPRLVFALKYSASSSGLQNFDPNV
jgi:predicted DNA binding CopG/RHH family protein